MSHKYKLTVPGPLAEQLEELAASAELAPSTLAGQFVAGEVARAAVEGKVRPLRQPPVGTGIGKSGARARWLEPYGGDSDWRADMWGQVVALHGRYPKALAWLQGDGGTTRHCLRHCARSRCGAPRLTTRASIRAKSWLSSCS